MPESGTYGSERGVSSNGHSYRDPPWDLAFHSGLSDSQPFATRSTVRVSCRFSTRLASRSRRPTSALA